MNFIDEEEHEDIDTGVHIHLTVDGQPPYSRQPLDLKEGMLQKDLSKKLKEVAKSSSNLVYPYTKPVTLNVRYQRNDGKAQATSIIGGIAESLRKLIYSDDSLVSEVHYAEQEGDKDMYWVDVTSKDSGHEHGHHHHH